MALFEQMRANVGKLLRGIDRYNPENLATLERYVETQAKENAYDLEANLAVLKLYQFNPAFFQTGVTAQILLKALTNLPPTDFTLCKCMIDQAHVSWEGIRGTPQFRGESPPSSVGIPPPVPWGSTPQFRGDHPPSSVETPPVPWGSPQSLDGVWGALGRCKRVWTGLGGHGGVLGVPVGVPEPPQTPPCPPESQLRVWMSKYGWTEPEPGRILISNQEENIKPKNIVEKIDFDSG
ncbi:EIF3K factor, partial [Tichodroma muraria]|nr:EIF3K factor [Tichodroma muraria]